MLDERFAAVVESIRAGASQREAARVQGIAPRTVASWLEKGRNDPSGRYGGFAEAVDEIREQRLHPPVEISDEPMGVEELQTIVWRAAVAGNVSAMMRLDREILAWLGGTNARKSRVPSADCFLAQNRKSDRPPDEVARRFVSAVGSA